MAAGGSILSLHMLLITALLTSATLSAPLPPAPPLAPPPPPAVPASSRSATLPPPASRAVSAESLPLPPDALPAPAGAHADVFADYIAARSHHGVTSPDDAGFLVPVNRLPRPPPPALPAVPAAPAARNGHTLFSGDTYRAPLANSRPVSAPAADVVRALGGGEAVETGAGPPEAGGGLPANEPNVAGEERLTDAQLADAREKVALLEEGAPPATTEAVVKLFAVMVMTLLGVLGLLSCARNVSGKERRALMRRLRRPKNRDAEE